MKRSLAGVTLLETLLALAIAGSILVLSIRMYMGYRVQQDLQQIQTNVDALFQAASNYYTVNCFGQGVANESTTGLPGTSVDSITGKPGTVGKLNPLASPAPATNVPLVITTDLQTPGFLQQWPPVTVALLNNASLPKAYVVQFNKVTSTPVWVTQCITTPSATPCTTASLARAKLPNASQIVTWRIQVSVLLKTPANAAAYGSTLGADCRSSLVGSIVTPCATSSNTGSYLVWERLPSMASPVVSTLLAPSMTRLKQNNLQYTHDQMYDLGDITSMRNQYYLCGG